MIGDGVVGGDASAAAAAAAAAAVKLLSLFFDLLIETDEASFAPSGSPFLSFSVV